MIESKDVVLIILVVAAATLTPIVLRLRRRSHAQFLQDYAAREVCEHLRGAMELLRSRGHRVIRAGQKKIAKVFGLPQGAVKLVLPSGRKARDDATVGALLRAWQRD